MSNIRPQARLPKAATSASLSAHVRLFSNQIGVWLGIICCAGFLIAGKVFPKVTQELQSLLNQQTAPLTNLTRLPAAWGSNTFESLENWINTYEENKVLRAKQGSLALAQATLVELQQENMALRAQLSLPVAPQGHHIAAQVLSQTANGFEQSFKINAGSRQGIKLDQAVMSPDGLVGRVLSVEEETATILLLTDSHSRIPVLGQTSRQRGILAGKNSRWLEMEYVKQANPFKSGEVIVTSGDGKTLPQGLPIGRVQPTQKGKWRVTPNAQAERLDWVSVVDYGWDMSVPSIPTISAPATVGKSSEVKTSGRSE